ncbi:MAG: hypothetical protein HN411_04555 [Waddliaceae bacterium]|jgi:asparagine synthase (glutamine-hydrolysing)|nr:hypothetical protein [Waddliaceae bacterium]MBT3579308.1 hypothetical protein [Waddliaceae bacterium]MBT4445439.1 hypothetical protein [Waddliaceae bacterium]MBT6928564.1 hypothetical protein [Waddliaceae bacterium]MBT7264889.1 hypothetical protein [Waddliaceae bacterium]
MGALAGVVHPTIYKAGTIIEEMLAPVSYRGDSEEISTYRFNKIEMGAYGEESIASNPPQTVWAMLDGTIFNEDALREELKDEGYRCNSDSTAEIIALSYECWGPEFLAKLNGSFSVAIFDTKKHRLLLARDKVGIKPIYWSHHNDTFLFGSELKSILATGLMPQIPAGEGIASYLFFGYIPQDISAIEGVNKLLPGYYLLYDFDKNFIIHPYWSYGSFFLEKNDEDITAITSHLDGLIKDSVAIRKDDEESSCFLGDDIASAVMACYAEKSPHGPSPMGCSTSFEGMKSASPDVADAISEKLGIVNTSSAITSRDILDNLVKITWFLDEPIADPSLLKTWKLATMAREQKISRVFSSVGSDEIFAGDSRYLAYSTKLWKKKPAHPVSKALIRYIAFPITKIFNATLAYHLLWKWHVKHPIIDYLNKNAVFNKRKLERVSPDLANRFDVETFLQKFFRLRAIDDDIAPLLYFSAKTSLPDNALHQYDRLTAANGLELRAPFLDSRIMEYMANIPDAIKIQKKETSVVLKSLLKDVFPEDLLKTPKKELSPDFGALLKDPALHEIFSMLIEGTVVESGYISKRWLKKRVAKAKKGKGSFLQLWAVLSLEVWMRLFVNTPKPHGVVDIPLKDFLEK